MHLSELLHDTMKLSRWLLINQKDHLIHVLPRLELTIINFNLGADSTLNALMLLLLVVCCADLENSAVLLWTILLYKLVTCRLFFIKSHHALQRECIHGLRCSDLDTSLAFV